MNGLGAWSRYFQYKNDYRNDPQGRWAYGIYGWKNELIYNGFNKGIVPNLAYFGDAMLARTKEFQASVGITVDGIIGPETGKYLILKRKEDAEKDRSIPNHWLAKIAHWESNDDIVAQGYLDPNDEGMFQYNGPSHPDLTLQERWSPDFIVTRAGNDLVNNFAATADWEGAVAAWNQGQSIAIAWVKAGKPSTGGPNNEWLHCYNYVQDVKNSAP